MNVCRVGVIGAGIMGTGIAADAAARTLSVVLVDTAAEALEAAEAQIRDSTRMLQFAKPKFRSITGDEVMDRISLTRDLEDLRSVDFVVENITENIELKETLYSKLQSICGAETVIGVNTSCISITRLAALCEPAERVVGMHFMNPVPMKGMVEVIRGFHTSQKTLDLAGAFLKQLDKEPVVVSDSPGFVSNRVMMPMINECAFLVYENVATAQEIDKVFRLGFAHTMGPLATADLIGLDTILQSIEVLHKSYHDSKFRPCPLLRKMVDAGLLGRKSGEGFFKYRKKGS